MGVGGAWVGDKALVWEDNGFNFILGGTGMSAEDAVVIAESVR
jgi:hypothetical protein